MYLVEWKLFFKKNLRCFADRGYNADVNLVVPYFNPNNDKTIDMINANQYHYRSVVETVFSRVKNFKAADYTFKQGVTFQLWALLLAYQLTAYQIKKSPLRNYDFFY